jgi:hypothetical protein
MNQTSRAKGVQDQEAGLGTRLMFWLIRRRYRRIPFTVRIRARDPRLLELATRMDLHTARRGAVPPQWKELAQLKVAAMVGCPF